MIDGRFPIRLRAPTPGFLLVWKRVRALGRIWAEYIALTMIVSFLIGPVALLSVIAVLLTIALPVAALTIWGCSLDAELGFRKKRRRR